MATIQSPDTEYQRNIAAARAIVPTPSYQEVRNPPTPSSVATPVASPQTPDAPVASYAASLGASSAAPAPAPGTAVVPYQQSRNMAAAVGAQPGLSPRTPDAPIASYAATLRPAATPAPTAPITVQPGSLLDLAGNVRGDIADAYNRGAQNSTATGVGMAAREAIISPVSRAAGALVDASAPVRSLALRTAEGVGEGVRAFITGRPPAPPAPAAGPAPIVSTAAAAPAQAPAPASAPQVVAQPAAAPVAAAPATAAAPAEQQRQFQVGNLTVTDQGNNRTITGDGPAPTAAIPSVRTAPVAAAPVPPAPVTSIVNSRYRPQTALGGAFGTAAALGIVKGENAKAQRGFKNEITAQKAADDSARTAADVDRLGAGAEQTRAETERTKLDTKNAIQLQSLRQQLVDEKDPKKRKVLENKIYALQGKKQGNFQVVTAETIDPGTGLPVKTPYIIDSDTGQARPIAGVGGGQAAVGATGAQAAPGGMTYVGRTPDGRKVYKDAQGKNVVEG